MSLVDSRAPGLDLTLQAWNRRLNRRFLSGQVALFLAIMTVPAAALCWFAAPSPSLRWAVWVGLLALTGLAAVVGGWPQRLTKVQAASWLDQQVAGLGLFRAAAECLEAEPTETGSKVLNQAEEAIESGRLESLKLPRRRWWSRVGAAGFLLAASGFWVGTEPPVTVWNPTSSEPHRVTAENAPPANEGNSEALEVNPREAARRLFPEDQRLAALAEQALASGDPSALEALLNQTQPQNRSSTSGTAKAPPNPNNPKEKAPGEGDPENRGTDPGVPGGDPGSGGASKPGQDKNSSPGSDPGNGTGSGNTPGTGTGEGSGEGSGGPATEGSPQAPGSKAGTGTSKQPLPWRPGQNTDRTLQPPTTEPNLLEYVLPGQGPKLPTGAAVAGSKRVAETYLNRTKAPLEVERTVQDYFLSLSQEVSP